jgi:hypothetical protein
VKFIGADIFDYATHASEFLADKELKPEFGSASSVVVPLVYYWAFNHGRFIK